MAPSHYDTTDTDDCESDHYKSDEVKNVEAENDRLHREIQALRQRNRALETLLPRGFTALVQNVEDQASSNSTESDRIQYIVERLVAHLDPVPFVPPKSHQICKRYQGPPRIKAFKKWATPQRLWIVNDYMVFRRGSRGLVYLPMCIPTVDGEVEPYQPETAPFVPGDTREIVTSAYGGWYYRGTYEIISEDILPARDASKIRPPHTSDMAKNIALNLMPRALRSHLLWMLKHGITHVRAIAVRMVGHNEEFTKFGQGAGKPLLEVKKESLKKQEKVQRLLKANKGLSKASRKAIRKKCAKVVVKKQESDSD
ncbi:unnamed protein product [Peniophora sp. CBMAI 1063]|nr:unnamed protein product [Peniophora sp. CBMAI 1063]